MKKKLLAALVLLSLIVITACKSDPKVSLEGFTISYEGLEDSKDFEKENYYLDRNQGFNFNIYLQNQDELEIVSIKISGTTYEKESFSDESTFTKIIINENTGNNSGLNLMKIEEIKYQEKNKTRNADVTSDQTLNLFVKSRFTPVSQLIDSDISATSAVLTINLSDRENLLNFDDNPANITILEGTKVLLTKALELHENEIVVNDLLVGQTYNYRIDLKYDINDGLGIQEYVGLEGNFKTLPPVNIDLGTPDETAIYFDYELNANDITITKITLSLDETELKEVQVGAVDNLEKGTTYELNFYYQHTSAGEVITGVYSVEATTFELLFETLTRNGVAVPHWEGGYVRIPTYKRQEEELRAIWFSTVGNIDIGRMQHLDSLGNPTQASIDLYKEWITIAFDNIKAANMNAVFFQIRPMNDAFYESELAPWSRYIAGVEGRNPGFDILEFALKEAHAREIELHAWLNPYRVATSEQMLDGMHDDNFAKKNPHLWLQSTNSVGALNTILDPGEPEVQEYIREVITEIMENYPTINGIHFDDYFYLDKSMIGEDSNSPDHSTYISNREYQAQSIKEFRTNSVTKVIRAIYEDVEAFNAANATHIKFGISPSGIWANKSTPGGSETTGWQHLHALYADTKHWIEEEIIHYIIPQIYWDFNDQPAARYANLVDWWSGAVRDYDVHLIIGMGPYRYRSGATPWTSTRWLADQLRYNQVHEEVMGASFFTYRDIAANSPKPLVDAINFIVENYWNTPARIPWETNIYD